MTATLERQIYEAIRGKCISDASAKRAAALAAELAVEKFSSTNSDSTEICPWCEGIGSVTVIGVGSKICKECEGAGKLRT